jgi:hypothetical protein
MVLWKDSSYLCDGWHEKDRARRHKPTDCVSVGLLIAKTKKKVILAMGSTPDQFGDVFAIPRSAIRKMWKLNDPTKAAK